MATVAIDLGTLHDVEVLYAYPNNPALGWSLCETVEHWFKQTLKRDGYLTDSDASITATADECAGRITLTLSADDQLNVVLNLYSERLKKFLAAGLRAYSYVVPMLKKKKLWDPRKKGWRFFLPLGLPMINHKSLQFFHYPPVKMLEGMQDYLDDPVPARIESLLMHNGVADQSAAQRYEVIIDGAPIAAPDDAGSAVQKGWGLIPIQHFKVYQREMIHNLLTTDPDNPDFTIPIIVYGAHPRDIFARQFLPRIKRQGQKPRIQKLEINKPVYASIVTGKTTPIIAAHHPYNFYWTAQVGSDSATTSVGDGKLVSANCKRAVELMTGDLITAGWQYAMAADSSQDIESVIKSVTDYWHHPDNAATVCALVHHQATLEYKDKQLLEFDYRVSLDQALNECKKNNNQTCSFTM